MLPPRSGRAATAATNPGTPMVLPKMQPQVDEDARSIADINNTIIDTGPSFPPK